MCDTLLTQWRIYSSCELVSNIYLNSNRISAMVTVVLAYLENRNKQIHACDWTQCLFTFFYLDLCMWRVAISRETWEGRTTVYQILCKSAWLRKSFGKKTRAKWIAYSVQGRSDIHWWRIGITTHNIAHQLHNARHCCQNLTAPSRW